MKRVLGLFLLSVPFLFVMIVAIASYGIPIGLLYFLSSLGVAAITVGAIFLGINLYLD